MTFNRLIKTIKDAINLLGREMQIIKVPKAKSNPSFLRIMLVEYNEVTKATINKMKKQATFK